MDGKVLLRLLRKVQDEVKQIVAGQEHRGVCIECLSTLIGIVAEGSPEWRDQQIIALEKLRSELKL